MASGRTHAGKEPHHDKKAQTARQAAEVDAKRRKAERDKAKSGIPDAEFRNTLRARKAQKPRKRRGGKFNSLPEEVCIAMILSRVLPGRKTGIFLYVPLLYRDPYVTPLRYVTQDNEKEYIPL